MVEILTKEQWEERGKALFGWDKEQWKFICNFCKRIQSVQSIREQIEKGITSKRFGIITKNELLYPEQCCYSQTCNYAANGLFNGPILVILDSTQPYNANKKENCIYVMDFAKGD